MKKMKHIYNVAATLMLCAGLTVSCNDNDGPGIPDGLNTDKEEITIGPEGGIETISVSSRSEWTAGASKPWISVSPANGVGMADCRLAIDSTLENTVRTSQIRFMSNNEQKLITVTQFGFGKQILIKEPEVELENSERYDKRVFEMNVTTNVAFEIGEIEYSFEGNLSEEEKAEYEKEREKWLTKPLPNTLEVNLDRKARPRKVTGKFRWEMNTAPFVRVAKVHLVPKNPEEDKLVDNDGNPIKDVVLTVRQKAAIKIEDNRAGDSLAVITICNKVQSMIKFDESENMRNWSNLSLWEATDKDLPCPEAVGRVRSVSFVMIDMKDGETLPKEIRHLKYLESFSIRSNANSQIRNTHLGEEICELKYLKELILYSYGITELPQNFTKLGEKLEVLGLSAANFSKLSDITKVVNKENFPKLKSLALNGSRRIDHLTDLSKAENGEYEGKPIGLWSNISTQYQEKQAIISLLKWENLRDLVLSYNFIEGELPSDDDMLNALDRDYYTEDDFSENSADYLDKLVGDTCRWLLTDNNPVTFKEKNGNEVTVTGQDVPRVLPKARYFSINLNFLTGPLPKWVLFHPYFVEWDPEVIFFGQQEGGKNSNGENVGFSNIDSENFDFTYYYGDKDPGENTKVDGVAYPLYYKRYVAK